VYSFVAFADIVFAVRPVVLLFVPDPAASELLRRILLQVGLECEFADSAESMLASFHNDHYDGAVIDSSAPDGGGRLLSAIRMSPAGASAILFALVDDRESMREAYRSGATFCLDKPLQHDRVMRCFHAAHGLILGERRRYYRHPYSTPVRLRYENHPHIDAMMINVSGGGLCIHSNTPLPANTEGRLEFLTDASDELLVGSFVVAWQNGDRYGLRFRRLSRQTRQMLHEWLTLCAEQALGVTSTPLPPLPHRDAHI